MDGSSQAAAPGSQAKPAKTKSARKSKKDKTAAIAAPKVVKKTIIHSGRAKGDGTYTEEYVLLPPPDAASADTPGAPQQASATAAFAAGTGKSGKKKNAIDPEAGASADTAGIGYGLDVVEDNSYGADLTDTTPMLSQSTVPALKAAIDRYTQILAAGGWPEVPAVQMQVGTNSPAVALLRQRLAMEGDYKPGGFNFGGDTYYDTGLGDAVQRYQARNGLQPTGDLLDKDRLRNGTRTITALNVPASARLAQLKVNLTRIQAMASLANKRYVMVNIPAQQIEAVEGDRVALRLNGVVGKPERPSPLVNSTIYELNFNPVWTLPPTVVSKDLIPRGRELQRKQENVLLKFGIDAYDGSGHKVDPAAVNWNGAAVQGYRFSQQPSKDNPLGFVKINFDSPQSVYMHDTPSQKLFDKEYRAASSGCIRVENMQMLASWLLRDTPGWSKARVASMKESGERLDAKLKSGVPLHWVYVTAWVSQDGVVHFRRDLYGRDQAFGVDKMASAY